MIYEFKKMQKLNTMQEDIPSFADKMISSILERSKAYIPIRTVDSLKQEEDAQNGKHHEAQE